MAVNCRLLSRHVNGVGGLEILIGFWKEAPFCESEKKMFNETNNRLLLAKVLLVTASQVGQKKKRKKKKEKKKLLELNLVISAVQFLLNSRFESLQALHCGHCLVCDFVPHNE